MGELKELLRVYVDDKGTLRVENHSDRAIYIWAEQDGRKSLRIEGLETFSIEVTQWMG